MTAMTSGMMSSTTDEWPTPHYVFDKLDAEFSFELDVCATDDNHKCARYFTKEIDGLKQEWKGVCWMNPPYGRTIGQWIRKAYESSLGGGQSLFALSRPGRTQDGGGITSCVLLN